MSKEKSESWTSMNQSEKIKNEETARDTWDSWVGSLEEKDQPESCTIDDPDCEACGS